MTDTKNPSTGQGGSLEGRKFEPRSFEDLAEALELAFDYRGDVTLLLKSGELSTGYVFNRRVAGTDSSLELFPSGSPNVKLIRYDEILAITFTGEDTASGKSWEAWTAKKESERRLDAERLAAEAKARGHL
jgi:hypothetical protein